jgi:hypothetical protein
LDATKPEWFSFSVYISVLLDMNLGSCLSPGDIRILLLGLYSQSILN